MYVLLVFLHLSVYFFSVFVFLVYSRVFRYYIVYLRAFWSYNVFKGVLVLYSVFKGSTTVRAASQGMAACDTWRRRAMHVAEPLSFEGASAPIALAN